MNTKGSRQHSPTPPKQKWQNICLALCILLGILASCETEESFYQPRFPANDVPLTRQALFKPENFFAYTDSTLKAVISALRRVEEEKHFTASFLLKYGIPLWNFTYKLTGEETCIFVPLYRLDKPHCIDAIWLLHIKDGWMKFFPLKRDDELIRESDQVFIFDLLSYLVFGEENAQGLTFKPHAQTRSVITVTQCWDVYTGPKDQLEYSYTNCVSHSYWVDDALINNSNWNSEGGGSGDVWIGGGSSGGSGSSSGTPAGNIFKKEADQDSLLWVITENMTARIMEDCLGGDLYRHYPCVAQDKPIRTEESLEGTVIYKKTTTFEVDGYTYQCDVDDGSQFVTLYNKENKLTYEKIVYKDTGKTYIGSWSSNVIEYDRFMSQQADFIVDQAFTKAMADEIGKTELMITMLLSPNTGEVMEVNFNFFTFEPYAKVPLHVYREIEVKLKEQIHFKPIEEGKQLNYIMLAWMQKPQGKLPPLPPPGSLM